MVDFLNFPLLDDQFLLECSFELNNFPFLVFNIFIKTLIKFG